MQIKANDLRLGNLLNRQDYIVKVTHISEAGIITEPLDFKGERFVVKKLEPIPITEEWLLKFEFESNSYGEFKKGDLNLDCEYTATGEWVVFLSGRNIKPVGSKNEYVCRYYLKLDIKYIHQLQNLYYCLTGEELEVKCE